MIIRIILLDMVFGQAQVDQIISTASADDPEVKLANLEREVDLIKTSIKRLLMDIRERMNELENPFTIAAAGAVAKPPEKVADTGAGMTETIEESPSEKEIKEKELKTAKEEEEELESRPFPGEERPVPPAAISAAKLVPTLRPGLPSGEKLRLHKVYRLFKWTDQSVRKYGHDRLEVMLDSFQSLGYITKDAGTEVKEISRLMPANLGEVHEVGPDEYVAELYALNRIIYPDDTSLDRDMIEVLMERRGQGEVFADTPEEKLIKSDEEGLTGKKPAKSIGKTDELMNLLNRI
jgi:hypothetical protein